MFFAKSVEYALRIVTIIALRSSEGPLRTQDVARDANVPVFYLQKVLRRLVKAGLLTSEKGHGGGFRLARDASKIYFIDVFNSLQLETSPKKCVFGLRACDPETPCVLHHRWNALNCQFQEWARNTSLEDVKGDVIRSSFPWGQIGRGQIGKPGAPKEKEKRKSRKKEAVNG